MVNNGFPHLATLPLEGVCVVPALPGLYPAQAPHVALPGGHLQPAVSPGGPVPLQVEFMCNILHNSSEDSC